ncbi:MAG: glycosyltransferase family 39 protein [Cyclobacteriaceae bacterium]
MKSSVTEKHLVATFVVVKLLIHFFTYDNLELHRDAYLYYAQSEHLAFGFIAVPPMIALIGKSATVLFGNTAFALRLFPALIGAANLVIIGCAVKELGGKRTATFLACLAYILSPSFLHSNALFQPVSFNQFFWLLSSYLMLLLVKKQDPKIWIWIGLVGGLGFLTKYSIVFIYAAFALGLLLSKDRKLFLSKHFVMGLGLGLMIALPNLIWQYNHNWPVLSHMEELRERQLVHVGVLDFIVGQIMMNMQGILLWLTAVIVLLFSKKEKHFRVFGLTYLFVISLLILGSGKAYYALGIYPILFAFGGVFVAKYAHQYLKVVVPLMVLHTCVSFAISLQFDGVPFVTFEDVYEQGGFKWEDGKYYDVPQDMADMTGWRELAEAVKTVYLDLEEKERSETDIFCYHYGQAGAIMFYSDDLLPQPICDNGSFIFWSPDSIAAQKIIWVHAGTGSDFNPEVELPKRFEHVILKTTIDNPYFRENGTQIYLCENPNKFWKDRMKQELRAQKARYSRHHLPMSE